MRSYHHYQCYQKHLQSHKYIKRVFLWAIFSVDDVLVKVQESATAFFTEVTKGPKQFDTLLFLCVGRSWCRQWLWLNICAYQINAESLATIIDKTWYITQSHSAWPACRPCWLIMPYSIVGRSDNVWFNSAWPSLRGYAQWVPVKGRWCSATGE